jgi:DNA-binding response OmpR family regulator
VTAVARNVLGCDRYRESMSLPLDQQIEPMVVMVADDDDDFRAAMVVALQADGHSTIEAHDGQELLELLERAQDGAPGLRPHVLVTDVKMPKLSGLGVLDAMRGASWSPAVVVVTALSDGSIDMVARRLGAAGVLHKPFGPDDLRMAVNNARRASIAG